MACFWKGINKELVRVCNESSRSPKELAILLKRLNTDPRSVIVQGLGLSRQQREEHQQAINLYDPKDVFGGYLCSTCDPFLSLICQVFVCDIEHVYMGTRVQYVHTCRQKSHMESKKKLRFRSNRGHFWAV